MLGRNRADFQGLTWDSPALNKWTKGGGYAGGMNGLSENAKRRVVCLTGPKEGAGKTTLALNLALAWAGIQSRNVVIVQLDPLCRDDVSPQLGLYPPTTLADFIRRGELAARGGPRPMVPLSKWGVGCLTLGQNAEQAARVTAAAARRALERLSAAYDLFLDVDSTSPLRRLALQLSTLTFWTCLPHRPHFDAAEGALGGASGKAFEVVINQCDAPGGLPGSEVTSFLRRLGKEGGTWMPHEASIPELANRGKLVVVEEPHSDWVKALRPLLGRVLEG